MKAKYRKEERKRKKKRKKKKKSYVAKQHKSVVCNESIRNENININRISIIYQQWHENKYVGGRKKWWAKYSANHRRQWSIKT